MFVEMKVGQLLQKIEQIKKDVKNNS